MVTGVNKRRAALNDPNLADPFFIWEPVPDLCTPEELENCYKALSVVQLVSPNHEELAAFFDKPPHVGDLVNREAVEQCSKQWLSSGIGTHGSGAVVVRAGKEGCFVASRNGSEWLPAYHQSAAKVADPTGGGNTFLGGLAIALARGKSVEEAAAWASVAASFAIEQVGAPSLSKHPENETWNGERVEDRLESFLQRIH
jgi:sugar/nucleoside kinase (ribokinase family)